jgi:hypothetical protein
MEHKYEYDQCKFIKIVVRYFWSLESKDSFFYWRYLFGLNLTIEYFKLFQRILNLKQNHNDCEMIDWMIDNHACSFYIYFSTFINLANNNSFSFRIDFSLISKVSSSVCNLSLAAIRVSLWLFNFYVSNLSP